MASSTVSAQLGFEKNHKSDCWRFSKPDLMCRARCLLTMMILLLLTSLAHAFTGIGPPITTALLSPHRTRCPTEHRTNHPLPFWMHRTRHLSRDATRRTSNRSPSLGSSDHSDTAVANLFEAAKQLRREAEELELQLRGNAAEEELERFFEIADINRDGYITFEGLRSALQLELVDRNANEDDRARAIQLLESEDRIWRVMQDLDRNKDGSLERDEWVSVPEFRNRLQRLVRVEKQNKGAVHNAIARQRHIDRRIKSFEAHTNHTGLDARVLAAICYLLPALEVASYGMMNVPPITPALVAASSYYQNVPMSGVVLLFALFNVAINYQVPRLVRFAARHACILDLIGAFVLPLAMRTVPSPFDVYLPTIFETTVLACAVTVLQAKMAIFIPTGQLAEKFTLDCDEQIRETIREAAFTTFAQNQTSPYSTTAIDFSSRGSQSLTPNSFFDTLIDKFYREAGIDRPVKDHMKNNATSAE